MASWMFFIKITANEMYTFSELILVVEVFDYLNCQGRVIKCFSIRLRSFFRSHCEASPSVFVAKVDSGRFTSPGIELYCLR